MQETPKKPDVIPQPWRLLGYLWAVGTSRFTLFVLAVTFFTLWRSAPRYEPEEAIRLEQARLRVEQQREEYERERLAILARVVGETAFSLEKEMRSTTNRK